MKHLKLFEDFNDVESIEDKLSDLFLEFEDEGWKVKVIKTKIVPDRNDWTGNFQSTHPSTAVWWRSCTQLRNVWGGEFIDYNKDVIMSKGDKKWEAVDCFVVNMSKLDHINPVDKTLSLPDKDTDNSFKVHWKNLDANINSKVSPIKERAKRLGLELFGIHGKWFTLGKATHQDFANQPYFGWEKLIDNIVFAFIPVKTNEGLFESFYDNKYIGKSDKSNWSDADKDFLDDVKIEAFSDYEFKENYSIEKTFNWIMKHIRNYQIFESSSIMEDIEDCCLELTDLPFGFYISEYKTGITTKIINTVNRYDYNRRPRWNDTKIPNAESSYIQLVGEVLNERLSLVTKGVWTGKIESLKIQKFNSHRMFKYDENTTIEELSKLEGGKYIKVILETLPSVLSKLTKFVIGEGKEIEFMINMYEVERGSCIVILIEFR